MIKIDVKKCSKCSSPISIQAGMVKGKLYASYRCKECGNEQAWHVHEGVEEIDPKLIGKL